MRDGARPVDWTALPPLALLHLLHAGCDVEDLAPPSEADYVAATGAASLPFCLLLCAVCRSWRSELRRAEPRWRNLLCARACRGLWAVGHQPPAVPPAALLRHRLTLRLAHAAGVFISLAPPHLADGRLRRELNSLLVGAHLPLAAAGRRAEADGAPTLLSVRLSVSGEPTFTFAVLGTHDSARCLAARARDTTTGAIPVYGAPNEAGAAAAARALRMAGHTQRGTHHSVAKTGARISPWFHWSSSA